MSDNQSEDVSYQVVVKAAESIVSAGKKVKIDLVRREIGFGNHAQIAAHLRKWQNTNYKHHSKSNNKNGYKQHSKNHSQKNVSRKQTRFYQQDDEMSYSPVAVVSPFCLDRFLEESDCVKALFLSICCIKQDRAKTIEAMRQNQEESFSYRKQSDQNVRQIKKNARNKINELKVEITRISVMKDHETNLAKSKL